MRQIQIQLENAKNALQYIFQVYFEAEEVNYLTSMHGEHHIPKFVSVVCVPTGGEQIRGLGIGNTKKESEKKVNNEKKKIVFTFFSNLIFKKP